MRSGAAMLLPRSRHVARASAATPLGLRSLPARSFGDSFRPASVSGRRKERLPANLGFTIVPQQKAFIVERLGKYRATLEAGFHLLLPLLDRVAYVHHLKEEAITIPGQTAITRDNVTLQIDGVLYIRVLDPYRASYGVEDAVYALVQLAQTTMRSELGKISLDMVFRERESLNGAIVASINAAAKHWGVECLRYEIKDIAPPSSVKAAMDLQAEAERRKRAEILDSEGAREAAINRAEGARRSTVLAAQGEAEAILARAQATSTAVTLLAGAVTVPGGPHAVALRVAEQYVSAFARLAKAGNTVVLPANVGDVSGMVAQALATYSSISRTLPPLPPAGAGGSGGAWGAPGASGARYALEPVSDSDPLLVSAMEADADAAAFTSGDSELASLMSAVNSGPSGGRGSEEEAQAAAAHAQPAAGGGGGGRSDGAFVPKPF